MHRNTYPEFSPKLLDRVLPDRRDPMVVSFAGQMTGVEGYVESRGIGHARRH